MGHQGNKSRCNFGSRLYNWHLRFLLRFILWTHLALWSGKNTGTGTVKSWILGLELVFISMWPWAGFLNLLSLIPYLSNELIILTLRGHYEYQRRWVIHGKGFSKQLSHHIDAVCYYFPIVSPILFLKPIGKKSSLLKHWT